jgi:RimJ/RimL family protein N-acetyltransferase
MTDLLDDLATARQAWTSPLIASWYSPDELRRQLRDAMAVEAGRVGDAAFGQQFRDAVGVDGPADPLAWANRRLAVAGGGWAVTGIRFRGGDARRPFVDVVATSEPPTPETLLRLAAAAAPSYGAFSPLCLRIDAPEPESLLDLLSRDARFGACAVDMHVVAERTDVLRGRPRVPAYDRVALRTGDPRPLATRVGAIYAELGSSDSDLAEWAEPEDAASLADCAAEGLLFEVLADGEAAGVVAARRQDGHGMTGFCVQELCLDAAHRGGRLAPAAVQRLVDRLPGGAAYTLWGTIHPDNTRSLRSALAVGRRLVGGYAWITPVGLPGMPRAGTRGGRPDR